MSEIPARLPAQFLKKGREFSRVKQEGRRRQTPLFNLVYCITSRPETCFGIVVGRRFGNAVERNRAKRIIRELVRAIRESVVPGRDCLVFPRRQMLGVCHSSLKKTWVSVLFQENILDSVS